MVYLATNSEEVITQTEWSIEKLADANVSRRCPIGIFALNLSDKEKYPFLY